MSIPGTIQITGTLSPTSTGDTYAILEDVYMKGGLRTLSGISNMYLIPEDRRKLGMIVGIMSGTTSGCTFWILNDNPAGDITTDNNWKQLGDSSFTWVIDTPEIGGVPGLRLKKYAVCSRIDSYVTDPTSVTFNIQQRSIIGTSGSTILSSPLASVQSGITTNTFSSANLLEGNWLWLDIQGVSGTPGKIVITLKTYEYSL